MILIFGVLVELPEVAQVPFWEETNLLLVLPENSSEPCSSSSPWSRDRRLTEIVLRIPPSKEKADPGSPIKQIASEFPGTYFAEQRNLSHLLRR